MIALALLAAAPLSCGAVPRPGVAMLGEDGVWRGTAVAACRRAAGRLDRPGIRFHGYRTRGALQASGGDDIAFLSPAEQTLVHATGRDVVTAAIAQSDQLLVAAKPVLNGPRPVLCFLIGTAAEDALETWLEATHRAAIRLGFQEPDEMDDGLASGKCAAMAIDAADRTAGEAIVAPLATTPIDATATHDVARLAAALR